MVERKRNMIVQATTGIVAKIKDTYGKEVLVNCQELKLCEEVIINNRIGIRTK